MDANKKQERYNRIIKQLTHLLEVNNGSIAIMATINAVLHHKMEYFFWIGFYLLNDGELTVGPYQGPVACQKLEENSGVCWAAINKKDSIIVEDVEKFPGHIACDSRSKSEIAISLKDNNGNIVAVFDVDSSALNSFDEIDRKNLEIIVGMVFGKR